MYPPRLASLLSTACAPTRQEVSPDNEILHYAPEQTGGLLRVRVQEESISHATTEMGSVMGDKETAAGSTRNEDDDLFLKPKTRCEAVVP